MKSDSDIKKDICVASSVVVLRICAVTHAPDYAIARILAPAALCT